MIVWHRSNVGEFVRNGIRGILVVLGAAVVVPPAALAADVTKPAEVGGLLIHRSGDDVVLSADPVSLDAAGQPETVTEYRLYRGTVPSFVPDRVGGTNRVGTAASPSFVDVGAAITPESYFYLISAVDASGNESASQAPRIVEPPVLTGTWTDTTVELSWSGANPSGEVAGYRVYWGEKSRVYTGVQDAGLATTASMTGLQTNTAYWFAVVAVDFHGNESPFSNEHVEAVAGQVKVRAHDDDYLCWGAAKCPPRPGAVQRSDGWQLMVPVDFPPGDWTKVTVTYTIDSRLCTTGQNQTTSKCGSGNPCLYPPCNGGYNPCGDPWDRTAHLFLVLDNCIAGTGSCITQNNLELMRAITPFGTDAPPPLGTGVVPPRVLTLDVTPYAPLLLGQRYVGAEIGHYVQSGWHVTVDFNFSKRPEEASPDPPARGIQVLGFGGAPLPTRSLTVPSDATKVVMRLFTTGHGGTLYCDGGSNDGGSCTSNTNCPGGTCQNCDEFCHRTNRILKDGAPVFTTVPFRNCCVGAPPFCTGCRDWNACGYPSCVYNRAGWCPGYIACHTDGNCDQDLDMTSSFPPGGTYDVGYDVLVQRGGWSVSLVAYWY